jgi:Domain of unknown function (DUF1737)
MKTQRQRFSPTEVYPPCPFPSGPANPARGTADRPLFVRPAVEEATLGYVILENDDTLRLTAEVLRRMAKGWKPLGGVSCHYDPSIGTTRYVQAMVLQQPGQVEPRAGDVMSHVKSRHE